MWFEDLSLEEHQIYSFRFSSVPIRQLQMQTILPQKAEAIQTYLDNYVQTLEVIQKKRTESPEVRNVARRLLFEKLWKG
ncbi:hypothetical protein H5410_060520 [Solanum commersonii]|uniref:Uncharacterized protein n=1 Tax=Solanum commersonii TaxID=4109 RepID=A0A9J5W5F9_SOLCO|nr:hypothetical protein H5410_060520 [Solanum commersonii]